jgi:hypothetical protein
MNRLKIGLLLSLPFIYLPINAKEAHHPKHINLGEHNETIKKILEFVDGGVINGNIFATIFDVRNKIHAIRLGDRDKTHKDDASHKNIEYTGRYIFRSQKYSAQQLAEIEANYVGDTELNALLLQAKDDFEQMVGKFIGQAKGSKDLLEKLILESCFRRNRKDSILLTWAGCTEGHETVIFHTEVQSFKTFVEFCQDLENYLEDLMYSCKKAQVQYKELKLKNSATLGDVVLELKEIKKAIAK